MFFVYVVWLFSAKVFISNASWVKFPSKYQLSSDSAGLFPCSFGGIARWENTWKIPQKYQLNSEVRPFSLLFWLEFIKIPLKFHQNTTQILKNATKIPLKYQKNSTRIHRNNSGKHAVNLDKIGGSISMEFQWNSIKIPLWFHVYLWNATGIPPEYCFKIPAFLSEGCSITWPKIIVWLHFLCEIFGSICIVIAC